MTENQKIAGPWQINANDRKRIADGIVVAEVLMRPEDDGYSWRAGARRGVEKKSDKCYANHATAVRAANAALVEQGYALFEAIAHPDRDTERKAWARLHKATEGLWMAAAIMRKDDAVVERAEQSAALQSLRDLGVDLDALLGTT